MHNNIMAASSRDRPPLLAMGKYAQWQLRFLRYTNTRPNGDALRKCILEGPYQPTTVTILVVPATADSLAVLEQTPTAHEMWIAIERLQQGESPNIQDVKTNLFWEFGKFTSHDGESTESYYSRFYKMMNEMIRNNLTVATMQVNCMEEGSREEDINSILNKFFDMIKNMSDVGNCIQAATTPFAKTSHMRPNDGVSSKDKHMELVSYASLLNYEPRGKKANFKALDNTETVEGTDLVIPMANVQ
ncbi:hypothetical protein Tco_0648072 [Tanacetum coccineum]